MNYLIGNNKVLLKESYLYVDIFQWRQRNIYLSFSFMDD